MGAEGWLPDLVGTRGRSSAAVGWQSEGVWKKAGFAIAMTVLASAPGESSTVVTGIDPSWSETGPTRTCE